MSSFDLHAWFHALDPTDRWLVEWRAQRDMSVKEISERSGLPPMAVAERLLRLRQRLAEAASAQR